MMDHLEKTTIIKTNVNLALGEDVGSGDLTASLIPEETFGAGTITARDTCTLCGIDWADATFRQIDPNTHLEWHYHDGDHVTNGSVLCSIRGPARALLTGERTALNFLQTLSAVATKTRFYVDAVAHTNARILDTRKTLPGLRKALKYAVKIGGGENHRIGLFDGVLIKENHIVACGGVENAILAARHFKPNTPVQIEIESLAELEKALKHGAKLILLDNLSIEEMAAAVELANGRALLEASGGITLSTLVAIAETGVDRISVGGLTKDLKAVDLSMRLTF
jgi:nicotinate-nucleotide pyrophosphorylase (carboxylating)